MPPLLGETALEYEQIQSRSPRESKLAPPVNQKEWEGEEDEWTEDEEDEFDIDGVVAWIEGTLEVKEKTRRNVTPEGTNAQKKKAGGRRSLFASK